MTNHADEKYSQLLRDELMDLDSSIRAEVALPDRGKIVTMGFPGLAFDINGTTYLDPDRMNATLTHRSMGQCRTLCVLLEQAELPEGGLDFLRSRCAEIGISVLHFPIEDYNAPDAAFERNWSPACIDFLAKLHQGETIALTCHYGAGRSGMIATYLLLQSGLSLEQAVATLRKRFPDSIENETQMNWLKKKSHPDSSASM